MNIIKLDAIDSTSVFLKDMAKNQQLENFTTVVADVQYNGKGQMNSNWHSEKGENLLFTFCVDLQGISLNEGPSVSFLVAVLLRETIASVLDENVRLQIKWPNDIMSYHKKLSGILVENSLQGNKIQNSFVGIGLNVNQNNFPENLPNATSLSLLSGENYDKDLLLKLLLQKFKKFLNKEYIANNKEFIKQQYLANLYKFHIPSMYEDSMGTVFMGKIVDVNDQGLLVIEKDDDQLYMFDVKEIKFL